MINSIEDLKSNNNKYDIMKILMDELLSLNYVYKDTEKLIHEYNKYFHTQLFICNINDMTNLENMLINILSKKDATKLINEFFEKDVRLIL